MDATKIEKVSYTAKAHTARFDCVRSKEDLWQRSESLRNHHWHQ